MTRRIALRLMVLVLATVFALTVIEGAHSLLTRESLVWDRIGREAFVAEAPTDGSFGAAPLADGRMPGRFVPSALPEVSFTLSPGATGVFAGAAYSTDSRGMRVVVGNSDRTDARRIAIVGDSVAFGYGVEDHETVASRLAEVYAAAGVPACIDALACPGWNAINALSFAAAMQLEIGYDAVYWLPVPNDLHDAPSVDAMGKRRRWFDPGRSWQDVLTTLEDHVALLGRAYELGPLALRAAVMAGGGPAETIPHVVDSDLTPTSGERWSALVRHAESLASLVRRGGGTFHPVIRRHGPWYDVLEHRLREALGDEACVPFLTEYRPEDRLAGDPHPNADHIRLLALAIAGHDLEAIGTKELPAGPWPGARSTLDERRAPQRSFARLGTLVAERSALWMSFLSSEIVPQEGRGLHQIYGGLRAEDFSFHRGVAFALAATPRSGRFECVLATSGSSGSWPDLELRVNGEVLRAFGLTGSSGRQVFSVDLPQASLDLPLVDLTLRLDTAAFADGSARVRLVSARLVEP